jgi:hypothetical protein
MKRMIISMAVLCLGLGFAGAALAGTLTVGSNASIDLGTGSLALGCADVDVTGTFSAGTVGFTQGRDVSIAPSGILNGNSATLQLSGDWDNSGSFNAGTSSVQVVDGCSLLSGVVAGNSTFNNFSITSALARLATFTAGTTQQVNGAFTVAGASGSLLQIRSSVGGTKAFINVQGTSSATFVNVADNSALLGQPIALPSNSIKGPNTPGWQLTPMVPLLPPLAAVLLTLALLTLGRRGLPRWRRKAIAP